MAVSFQCMTKFTTNKKKIKKKYKKTHRARTDLWLPEVGKGGEEWVEKVDKGSQKVQPFSYKIN